MIQTIGIIGGGQLAQMMALAAYPLGLKTICLEPGLDCPASQVTRVLAGDYHDVNPLNALVDQSDVLTYEFENIDCDVLENIFSQSEKKLFPPLKALKISQDRLQEKRFFDHLCIPTTHYIAIDSLVQLEEAITSIGFPAVLKTRRFGYDGKGQYILREVADLAKAWENLNAASLLLENKIDFDREVSCIGVRNQQGDMAFYALTKNEHRQGILHISSVLKSERALEQIAQDYTRRILEDLDYVGVLAVEFFEKAGTLIANEMAPRVHNSGHWTIEGAQTSQFENHLRAVCGLPLGSTETRGSVAMLNLVGQIPDLDQMLGVKYAHCHLYGKAPRPGRKLGHITVCHENAEAVIRLLEEI